MKAFIMKNLGVKESRLTIKLEATRSWMYFISAAHFY